MERILNQKHSKEAYRYAFSVMLERTSYYGVRALLVLYLVGDQFKMSDREAVSLYASITGFYTLSKIVGALLGGLVIGNKKAFLIGGLLQALGVLSLCMPTIIGLYLGLALIILGGGLYSPNMTAQFGKLYLDRTKMLDAGFMLYQISVNTGAFIGVALIGILGEYFGFQTAFFAASILMIGSIALSYFTEYSSIISSSKTGIANKRDFKFVLITLIYVALFWLFFGLLSSSQIYVEVNLPIIPGYQIPYSLWNSIGPFLAAPFGLFLMIYWSKYYSPRLRKLLLGFVFGVISFGLFLCVNDQEIDTVSSMLFFVGSLLCLSLAEIYLWPIVYAEITEKINPKFIAIAISLASLPMSLVNFMLGVSFLSNLHESGSTGFLLVFLAMILVTLSLLYLVFRNNMKLKA
jgi:POT family proton-dependent oligopeptide transporter